MSLLLALLILVFVPIFGKSELGCESPWQSFEKFCYLSSTTFPNLALATWHDAESVCNIKWAHLVSINSETENDFVVSMVNGTENLMWIGLRNDDPLLDRFWSDYSSTKYMNWNSGEPNNGVSSIESCTQIYTNVSGMTAVLGTWNDISCQPTEAPYICKKLKYEIPPSTPPPDKFGCDGDWFEFNGKCLKVFTEYKTLDDAKAVCASMRKNTRKGHTTRSTLLTIRDVDDQEFLMTKLWALQPPWMGFKYVSNPEWVDDLMTLEYQNWATGQGNNPPVHLLTTPSEFGKWCDDQCFGSGYSPYNLARPYVCTAYKHYLNQSAVGPPRSLNEINCPDGFVAYGWNCYFFGKLEHTNHDAIIECEGLSNSKTDLDVELSSVLNLMEENFLVSNLKRATFNEYWIGLNRMPESFKWIDHWPFQYDATFVKESNQTIPFCATISLINSKLVFTQRICDMKLPSLCKGRKPETRLDPASTCSFQSGCYSAEFAYGTYTDPNEVDFESKLQMCQAKGMELAEFNSYAEMANLVNVKEFWAFDADDKECPNYSARKPGTFAYYHPSNQYFYIGLLKLKDDEHLHWSSSSEPVKFTRWGIDEPKHSLVNGYDIYIVVDHYGFWHTVSSAPSSWGSDNTKCYPSICKRHLSPTPISTMSTTTTSTTSTTTTAPSITTREHTSTMTSFSKPTSTSSALLSTAPSSTASTTELSLNKHSNVGTVVGSVFAVIVVVSILGLLYRFRLNILNRIKSRYHQPLVHPSETLSDDVFL